MHFYIMKQLVIIFYVTGSFWKLFMADMLLDYRAEMKRVDNILSALTVLNKLRT